MMLITLKQAKDQIRQVHDMDDASISLMIAGASRAAVTYLKDYADTFLDTSGEPTIQEDTSGNVVNSSVPEDIQMAVAVTVAEWSKNREAEQDGAVDQQFGYGYALPRVAIALLYPYRVPTLR